MNLIIRNILRFIAMIILQGLLLNEVDLGVYVNPYIYILFIMMLPFETPDWLLMLSAFLLGVCIDAFSNTHGLHASACVFLAFARPTVLKFMKPREGYEAGRQPGIFNMGAAWFMYYSVVMIVLHHAWFFILEYFRFADLPYVLLKIAASTVCTWVLVVLAQLLTGNTRET